MIQMSDVVIWAVLAIVAGIELARFMVEKESQKVSHPKRKATKIKSQLIYHSKDKLFDTVLTAIQQAEHDKKKTVTVVIPSDWLTVKKAKALEKTLSIGNYQVLSIDAHESVTCMDIEIEGMY